MARLWNNLHQVHSTSKDWKAKLKVLLGRKLKAINLISNIS